jgi:hypothetical protein
MTRREKVWIVTGSGSRRLDERADLIIGESDDDDATEEDDDEEEKENVMNQPRWDCQLKFWKVPVDVTYHHHQSA